MNINVIGGKNFFIIESDSLITTLPNKNFLLERTPNGNFFLSLQEDYTFPPKIYGEDNSKFKEKVLSRYSNVPKTLGVLLNGEKGSGKTLLAQSIAKESNLPVILINEGFEGVGFQHFIAAIEQKVVLFFDEFDKNYASKEAQKELLQIFEHSGKFPNLIILTSNVNTTSEYLQNRPSRIFYAKNFSEISDELLNEIVLDRVAENCKVFLPEFKAVIEDYSISNVDSLLALISEVNRLKVSPNVAVKDMNLTADPYQKIWQVSVLDYPITITHSVNADVNFSWKDVQYLEGKQGDDLVRYLKSHTKEGRSSFTVDLELCKRELIAKNTYLFKTKEGFEFTLQKANRNYNF